MDTPSKDRVVFRDAEILRLAGNLPAPIIALFKKYNLDPPAVGAVYQWTSRKNIPDKWRAGLIFMLLTERKITIDQLFGKARLQDG